MSSEIEAVSKATAEVARTTGKAIDASSGFGSFLKQIFGPALEEYGAQFRDSAQFRRATNLMRLKRGWEELRLQQGITDQAAPLPFKFGVELLEAAAIEDDEELQKLFANLLFNTTSTNSKADTRTAYVAMLREMAGFDVRILFAVADAPSVTPGFAKSVYTANFPDGFLTEEDGTHIRLDEPPDAVAISLYNLVRMGCIAPTMRMNGVISVGQVTFTALGQALVKACRAPGSGPLSSS